jgi:hypothetical protein
MRKKKSEYRETLNKLREENADKLTDIFSAMYTIVRGEGEDKDKVNAAKVLVSLLGVPRPAPEKTKMAEMPEPPKKVIPKPELSPELKERLKGLHATN